MKHLLALSLLFALFFDSHAGAAGRDVRALQLIYQPWNRICVPRPDGNSDCFVFASARGACEPSGGGISIVTRDEKQRSLSANLGTRHPVEGPIGIRIDDAAPILIAHPDCHALGCRGRIEINTAFIERLKQATAITVEATTSEHQAISLSFPLADFAKANDGPAHQPPKAAETSADQLQERLKRAAQERPPQCEE